MGEFRTRIICIIFYTQQYVCMSAWNGANNIMLCIIREVCVCVCVCDSVSVVCIKKTKISITMRLTISAFSSKYSD